MSLINLLRKRRSIRRYTSQRIDRQTLDILVEALLRSPSSHNSKPWEFILVDDPLLLAELSTARMRGGDFLKEAQLGIVIAADSHKSDVWIEDTSIAATFVQAAAESMGLGSCWIQIRNRPHDTGTTAEAFVQDLLGIPEHIKVTALISIGWPDETKPQISADKLDYHKVKYNHHTKIL